MTSTELPETLINGWEASVPIGDTIVKRFVYAYADRTAAMAAAIGGRSESDEDAAFADNASVFLYDNAVVLKRPLTPAQVGEVVRRAYAFFPPERPWALLSVFPLGDLSGVGLTLDGHPPLMVRPPGPAPAELPEGLTIEPVRTSAQLAEFTRVIEAGYPGLGSGGAVADQALVDGGVLHLFVGYLDGKGVATSGAAVNHGVVEVDWVCTLPEFRGRRIGATLTAAATAVDPTLPAVLIASDEGRPVYERLGYLSIQRATLWTRLPDWSRSL